MPFFGSFGPTEMIFVMVVLLLVFGAKRLPELGSGLGKGIREFKRSMTSLGSEIERSSSTEERELNPGQRPPAVPASTTEPKRDDSTD
ncbi:MAG: Sec-independent protein translocase subunit TatA/TatB, partial [Longimicrobiales bacterium]